MNQARPLTDYEQAILDNVEQFGCQVTSVFTPDGVGPGFSYSIGFKKTVQQPEVIIFGLSSELMHSMINNLLEQCRQGLILNDGVSIDGLLSGFQCIARKVHPNQIETEYFNSSMWYHKRAFGSELVDAVQIVWPGAVDGKFPWEKGSSDYVQEMQPPLYQPSLVS